MSQLPGEQQQAEPPSPPQAASYKIKVINLPDRRMPVVMQAANGPCPLLALANVLLLRGNISLPLGAPDISEERLVSIVAGWLLDRNDSEELGKLQSAEYTANLERNVADAVSRLPKLTTGIDVNPRFHDCRAFEFTDEVAIFDLLQVPLLHGWLVDPQDEEAVKVIGGTSYNELLSRLITMLGDDTPAALAPLQTAASGVSLASPPGTLAGATAPQEAAANSAPAAESRLTQQEAGDAGSEDSDASFTQRLQEALKLSLSSDADASSGGKGAPGDSLRTSSAVVTPNSAAAAAFDSALVTPGHSRGGSVHITGAAPGIAGTAAAAAPPIADPNPQHWGSPPRTGLMPVAERPAPSPAAADGQSGAERRSAAAAADAAESASATMVVADSTADAPAMAGDDDSQAVRRLVQAAFRPHLSSAAAAAAPKSRDPQQLAEAELIQEFLGTSQLTYHGLAELHQALNPGQLAVFFRNNHFGTLVKFGDSLFLLVTDQGYLREPGVVWERLSGIDGDAQFFQADFKAYGGKSSLAHEAAVAATLAQAAFSGGTVEAEAKAGGAGGDGGGQGEPNTSADADLALALHMQEEEAATERERQARAERERTGQARPGAAGQQQGRRQPQQEQQQGRRQRRPGSAERQQGRQQVIRGKPPEKDSKCKMM